MGYLHRNKKKPQPATVIVRQYLVANWWLYSIAIVLIIVSSSTQVQIPRILGRFTDALKQGSLAPGDPVRYAGTLALLAIGYVATNFTAIYLLYGQSRHLEYHLRNQLFAHWESLSAAYYTYHSVGDLMAYATNDVHNLRASLGGGVFNLVSAIFTITLTVTMMVGSVDASLALFSLIPLPFLTIAITILRPMIKKRSRKVQDGFSMLAERTEESISGVRVSKSYAREEFEIERFSTVAKEIVRRSLSLTKASALFSPLIQLVGAISFLIALGLGGARVINGDLTLGELVAFQYYLAMLIGPMQQIAQVIDVSQRAGSAMTRLSELLTIQPDVVNSNNPAHVNKLRGQIVLQSLSFSYPQAGAAALSGISLHVAPGQTIGILGATGSGKSTIANLLLRVYDPPRGTVFLDGYDILDIPLSKLRRQIGYVPQDIFLFSASIKENIAFAVKEAGDTKVEQAAKQAQLYDSIMDFPDRFETEIGERGVTLSGGQKQRLALARALIKEAPILILDDSLSAVDTETEAAILTALQGLRGRQTTLIIAHRISAVREADVILVLNEGTLVQSGNHDALLAVPGPYREIYELQKKGTGTVESEEPDRQATQKGNAS